MVMGLMSLSTLRKLFCDEVRWSHAEAVMCSNAPSESSSRILSSPQLARAYRFGTSLIGIRLGEIRLGCWINLVISTRFDSVR